MIHQAFCPNTSQQNGVAERENRTLLEISRALLIESHAPAHFWPEAITTATYLTNRLPSKPLNCRTPLDTLGSFVSLLSHHSLPPRIFGCVVFVHLSKHSQTKLEPRAINEFLLSMEYTKRGIDVLILYTIDCILLWIVTFLRTHSTIPSLALRRRV